MVRLALMALAFSLFMVLGCASHTPSPEPVLDAATASAEPGQLPVTHGPLGKHDRAVRAAQEVCLSVRSLRTGNEFIGPELLAVTTQPGFYTMAVTNADEQVLKGCVASNWVPLVVLRTEVGRKHLRGVVGYDSISKRWHLLDPTDTTRRAIMGMGYESFTKQWNRGQNICLLIFPEYTNERGLRAKLGNYLPLDKVDSIEIQTAAVRR